MEEINYQFRHGQNSDVDTSAEQLTATSFHTRKGVVVKAADANSGTIYVGNSSSVTANSADATDGFELGAGQSITIEIDDPSKIYVIASAANQKVFWLAL